jgi:hypothetical protein
VVAPDGSQARVGDGGVEALDRRRLRGVRAEVEQLCDMALGERFDPKLIPVR